MKTRRGADIDEVESLLSEQGVYLWIDPRFRKKLSGQLRLFGIGLHDSNYSEMIVLSPCGQVRMPGHIAKTNDRSSQRVSRHRWFPYLL
jgi:hypothetical protein